MILRELYKDQVRKKESQHDVCSPETFSQGLIVKAKAISLGCREFCLTN